jgi:hypothetical protein
VSQSDREYFGFNRGTPLKSHASGGMLTGGQSLLETPCYSVNRTVPYFEEVHKDTQGDVEQVVFDGFEQLNNVVFDDDADKSSIVPGAELLPDGYVKVSEANKRKLKVTLSTNDFGYFIYHKNTGVSKIGFI